MRIQKYIAFTMVLGIFALSLFFYSDLEKWVLLSRKNIERLASDSIETISDSIAGEVSAPPPLRSERDVKGTSLTESGVLKYTNIERQKESVPVLKQNDVLARAALGKAEDMFKNQYFAHVSPSGKGPQHLAEQVGYVYIAIGENLALGNFLGDEDLVAAWMASPGHRENILSKKFTQIGIAVVEGTYEGEKTWIAVQEFGTPETACPEISEMDSSRIESEKREIDQLAEKIDRLKKEIDKADSRKESNALISEYNEIVKRHNDLVAKTKDLIENYNARVSARNKCVKKFGE